MGLEFCNPALDLVLIQLVMKGYCGGSYPSIEILASGFVVSVLMSDLRLLESMVGPDIEILPKALVAPVEIFLTIPERSFTSKVPLSGSVIGRGKLFIFCQTKYEV